MRVSFRRSMANSLLDDPIVLAAAQWQLDHVCFAETRGLPGIAVMEMIGRDLACPSPSSSA